MSKMKYLLLVVMFTGYLTMSAVSLFGQQGDTTDYSRGVGLFLRGNYSQALASLQEAVNAHPNDPRPLYYVGLCVSRLGDSRGAAAFYAQAARVEFDAKGGTFDMGMALRSVQGSDRLLLEKVRKETREQWRKERELQQVKQFGETLSQEKEVVSLQNRYSSEKDNFSSRPSGDRTRGGNLPSIAPISPLMSEERDVVKVPNLYDLKDEDFAHFRDELGRTTLSTAEAARQRELERRVVYADPMDKPAKDGSKFVNIYDPLEVSADENAFFGMDDPDDMYKDFERGPLAISIMALESYTGKSASRNIDKKKANARDQGMGSDSGMSSGMDNGYNSTQDTTSGNGSQQAMDDSNIFRSKAKNPHTGGEPSADANDELGLFSDDLKFTPPKQAPTDNYGGDSMMESSSSSAP